MGDVHAGRYTAEIDGEFVVFVIGMRFNKLYKPHKWLPVALAMPRMIRSLRAEPAKGLLSVTSAIVGRTTLMIQYWRSYDDLESFARDPGDEHLPAWRAYNKAVGTRGDVGVWHETYKVAPGEYEAVYANMPVFGLARASRHLPVAARGDSSRQRITADASR